MCSQSSGNAFLGHLSPNTILAGIRVRVHEHKKIHSDCSVGSSLEFVFVFMYIKQDTEVEIRAMKGNRVLE